MPLRCFSCRCLTTLLIGGLAAVHGSARADPSYDADVDVDKAYAPSAVDPTPPEATPPSLKEQAAATLESIGDFLDDLATDMLGPDPRRRYRVDGKRKMVDLGKRWTLALDQRPTGVLGNVGVGIPAAGQPTRTWELLHDGKTNNLRFYNHTDGSGREAGLSDWITIAPGWQWYGQGMRVRDTYSGVSRTEAQTGLRVGPSDLWAEGFLRAVELDDTIGQQDWGSAKPAAAFAGLRGQWEMTPSLSLMAQTQQPIYSDVAPGDERLADPRTEIGADYRPPGAPEGTRVYWREAFDLGLLSSNGLEERATYRRVLGVEAPEGSPDGMVYAQIRHQSLLADEDALLVLGWRHTTNFAPKWTAFSLIETGIPVSGDNPIRSTTLDLRLNNDAFPHHVFSSEIQYVQAPLGNTGFITAENTRRFTQNSLLVLSVTAAAAQPKDYLGDTRVNSGNIAAGWGWQEPEERRFSTFWRAIALTRDAVPPNIVTPEIADRQAYVGSGEFTYKNHRDVTWLLRDAMRWDSDESFEAGAPRTTNLVLVRATKQLSERWSVGAHVGSWNDSALPSQQALGFEVNYKASRKVMLAVGVNPLGIDDPDLNGTERLKKGVFARAYVPTETTLTRWLSRPMPTE